MNQRSGENIWLDSSDRYGLISRLFHWGMALLILWQFMPMVTWRLFGESAIGRFVYSISLSHFWVGNWILTLVMLRGLWALINMRRRRKPRRGFWDHVALLVHLLLYALTFSIPALAFLRAYGGGFGVELLGVTLVAPTGVKTEWMVQLGNLAHGKLAWTLFLLIAAHTAAALVHRFLFKDDTLARMALWRRHRVSAATTQSSTSGTSPMPRICPPTCLVAFGIAISLMILPANVQPAISAQSGPLDAGPTRAADLQFAQADTTTVAPTTNRPTVTLPNGATSINESYGDWTVNCSIVESQKACVFSQAQGNSQTGQRTFAIELRAPLNGMTEGVLLMPFGLKLADGAKLRIDELQLGQGVQYSMCVPQGCLVPVSFPTVATDAMKRGTTLNVTATNSSGDQPVEFAVSLAGFTAAMNRVAELAE